MRTLHFTALLMAAIVTGASNAQVPAIVVHDLASATGRGNSQIKAVVTDEGSVGFAMARPSVTQTGHHHQQEQVVLPLEKPMAYTIAGTTSTLGKYAAAIPPANTHHFYTTHEGDPTPFIEYQPVRRDDWIGLPYKPMQTPEPVPLPAGRETVRDLSPSSPGWTTTGAARTKEFAGELIKVVLIELRGTGTSIDVRASAAGRQFLYVLEGKPSVASGALRQTLAPHAVVEMLSAAPSVRVESPRDGTAVIALFGKTRR